MMKTFLFISIMISFGVLSAYIYTRQYKITALRFMLYTALFTAIVNGLLVFAVAFQYGRINLEPYKRLQGFFLLKYMGTGTAISFFTAVIAKRVTYPFLKDKYAPVTERKNITIPVKYITLAAVLYLAVPIAIFFLTWTRIYVGVPAACVLSVGFYFAAKRFLKDESVISINAEQMVIIAVLFLAWVWTTGIGNFFVPTHDHPWRTAIFRDIVNFSWPVIYPETGNALVYYLVYWIVPAIFGKLFGWTAANVALLLWTWTGVMIVFFILCNVCRAGTKKQIWITAILLFGWSGLNTTSWAIMQILNLAPYGFFLGGMSNYCDALFNGYSFNFFYRSNVNALPEIFNQVTPLWIATLLTLKYSKDISLFAFIGLCLFPYAPLPFIGLVIIMVAFFAVALNEARMEGRAYTVVKSVFSIPNMTAIFSVFIVFALYFTANGTSQSGEGGGFFILPLHLFDYPRIVGITVFWIFQFGVVSALIFPKYKKNQLFWTVVVSLVFIPFVEFGKRGGRDFCMNASLPALFILMKMTICYFNENVLEKPLGFKNIAVVCTLLLCMLSNIQEMANKFDTIGNVKKFPIVNDWEYTLSDLFAAENFLSKNGSKVLKDKTAAETEKDLAKARALMGDMGIDITEGYYAVSPKMLPGNSLQTVDATLAENYSFKDLTVCKPYSLVYVSRLYPTNGRHRLDFPSRNINRSLDVPGGVINEKGNISTYPTNSQPMQQFQIVAAGDYFKILYGEHALTFNTDDNTVHLSKDNNLESQMWKFEKFNKVFKDIATVEVEKDVVADITKGYYTVSPKKISGKYLQAVYADIVAYYSRRELSVGESYSRVYVDKPSDSKYRLDFLSQNMNRSLDVPGGIVNEIGTVSLWPTNNLSTQHFKIIVDGNYFKILYGEHALTFNADNNTVYLAEDMNLDSQMWKFEKCK